MLWFSDCVRCTGICRRAGLDSLWPTTHLLCITTGLVRLHRVYVHSGGLTHPFGTVATVCSVALMRSRKCEGEKKKPRTTDCGCLDLQGCSLPPLETGNLRIHLLLSSARLMVGRLQHLNHTRGLQLIAPHLKTQPRVQRLMSWLHQNWGSGQSMDRERRS